MLKSNKKFTRILALLTAAVLLCTGLAACGAKTEAPAASVTFAGSGTDEDPWLVGRNDPAEVEAFMVDSSLFIRGSGTMADFADPADRPWNDVIADAESVMIFDGLAHIGTNAFRDAGTRSGYFDVFLTVNGSIGESAFEGANLRDSLLYFGTDVQSIGAKAFAGTGTGWIEFAGAPEIAADAFSGVEAEVHFHSDYPWAADLQQNYGGTLTYVQDYAVNYYFDCGTDDFGVTGTSYIPEGENFFYNAEDDLFEEDGFRFVRYEVEEGELALADPAEPQIDAPVTGPVSLRVVCEAAEGSSVEPLDYTDASLWAYYEDSADREADVFLVCPTVDLGRDGNLNMDLANEKLCSNFLGALNMERGIYDGRGNMFSPYYRQVTLPVYSLPEEEAAPCYAIAYGDVRAAFEQFLSVTAEDRPIILAGFSQGSELMLMLMKDYLDDPALQERLVAAYAIGWRVTEEDLETYPWLKMAQGEDDTGVIIAFNSEAEGVSDSLMVPEGCFTYSINPLNWMTDGTEAPAELNLGACFTNYSAEIKEEIPALCGARINPERGTLIVTGVTPEQYPGSLFPDGIYHLYDYQFFYRNLQHNVETRLDAWLNR